VCSVLARAGDGARQHDKEGDSGRGEDPPTPSRWIAVASGRKRRHTVGSAAASSARTAGRPRPSDPSSLDWTRQQSQTRTYSSATRPFACDLSYSSVISQSQVSKQVRSMSSR
jgi:hypothetical protein